jgi:hypothetical protein
MRGSHPLHVSRPFVCFAAQFGFVHANRRYEAVLLDIAWGQSAVKIVRNGHPDQSFSHYHTRNDF